MNESGFHILDIMAVVIPMVLVGLAFYRGVVMEVILFLAWAVGIIVAKMAFGHTYPWAKALFDNQLLIDMTAIGMVLVPIVVTARWLFAAVSDEINSSHLGLMNRGMGAAVGLIRGVMLAWLLVGLASWSFFRSAPQMMSGKRQVTAASSLSADLPLHDILCGQGETASRTLIRKLQGRSVHLSSLAEEIVAFNADPKQFPAVNMAHHMSVSLCGKKA